MYVIVNRIIYLNTHQTKVMTVPPYLIPHPQKVSTGCTAKETFIE